VQTVWIWVRRQVTWRLIQIQAVCIWNYNCDWLAKGYRLGKYKQRVLTSAPRPFVYVIPVLLYKGDTPNTTDLLLPAGFQDGQNNLHLCMVARIQGHRFYLTQTIVQVTLLSQKGITFGWFFF